jgi:hypothetical protein
MARPQARRRVSKAGVTGARPPAAPRAPAFPWRALGGPLPEAARRALLASARALAADARARPRGAPDATPFVSLYVDGGLRGCCGCDDGDPGGRLAVAFREAFRDRRFAALGPAERARLAVQVSYVHGVRRVEPREAVRLVEPGTHGLAVVPRARAPAMLLPHVARDRQLDGAVFCEALARKAGLDAAGWRRASLYLFETDDVTLRPPGAGDRATSAGASPAALAARWLRERVAADGRVAFAVDARARAVAGAGVMRHGRAAVVIQALAAHGGAAAAVVRARRWLGADIEAALAGRAVAGWPERLGMLAGTLALAALAGVRAPEALAAVARRPELAREPWHAAQVAAALGPDTPAALWRACVADLVERPFAPWTALAARARGDAATLARCERALAASVRREAPHAGGVDLAGVPQLAQTAAAVEALAGLPSRAAQAAVARGAAFLRRWQVRPGRVPAPLDPALAAGAFPASPVVDWLRADVTAHALLALRASET